MGLVLNYNTNKLLSHYKRHYLRIKSVRKANYILVMKSTPIQIVNTQNVNKLGLDFGPTTLFYRTIAFMQFFFFIMQFVQFIL